MTPTVIEDSEVPEGAIRIVVGPPDGDITGNIRPVEAIVLSQDDSCAFVMKIALDDGDIERLAECKFFWIAQMGHQLQPFDVFLG
jgi:hypothetical protein